MEEMLAQDVYDTLEGNLRIPVPDVEDAFSEGSVCDREYERMLDAYERLKERLGTTEEDEDVEIIITSLRTISYELGMRMFYYGMKFAKTGGTM